MKKILFLLLLFPALSNGQANLDSLFGVWNDLSQPDTSRLKAMGEISWEGYLFTETDSAFYFAQMQYDLAKEKGLKKYMAMALNTQGVTFYFQSDYAKAIHHYTKSLKLYQEMDYKLGIASSFNNIGGIYREQGNYGEAIHYYSKS
jgi:tetratricopeptide (TPR) repeat protein